MVNNKAKVAVMVSGGGTNLQALIDAEANGILHSGEICLVVSDKADAFALQRAEKAGIKTETVLQKDFPDRDAFCRALIAILEKEEIDLIVLAGFLAILSPEFTGRFKNRILNIHPSLIPSFCGKGFYGLKVHEAALACGVKVSGATVHFVNEVPDGGKILAQKAVNVEEGDTPELLQRRIMEQAEWVILPETTEKICSQIVKGEVF